MKSLLIIDWRALTKSCSYSIFSDGFIEDEKEAIRLKIIYKFLELTQIYPDHSVIIADDCPPYWRTPYLKLQGIEYKGNRGKQPWKFRMLKSEWESEMSLLQSQLANAVGARVVRVPGWEADDVAGVLAVSNDTPMVLVSSDSDWAQLAGPLVTVVNLHNEKHDPCDIRVKLISGDPGDSIPGVPKLLKNGLRGSLNYGKTGALKLLEEHPDWEQVLGHHAVQPLQRNREVIILPCPSWDLDERITELQEHTTKHDKDPNGWEKLGIHVSDLKDVGDRVKDETLVARMRNKLLENRVQRLFNS